MKALILGGGSLKGAFQVGAIQAVLESGFEPDMIYGNSVGALNASFLVHEATKQQIEQKKTDWHSASRKLLEFWVKNITNPTDIATQRSRLTLGMDTFMSRFDGLLDPTPLHNLIRKYLDEFILRNSTIKLKVGTVEVTKGDMVYATPQHEDFINYVLASSALPMLMPAVHIKDQPKRAFLDGGLREVAPLKVALHDGATDIVCIACHAEQIYDEPFNYRNFFKLSERVKDITVNQLVNSDISWAQNYIEKENLRGKPLKMKVIRPFEPLKLDMLSFSSDDIVRLILEGFKIGYDAVEK